MIYSPRLIYGVTFDHIIRNMFIVLRSVVCSLSGKARVVQIFRVVAKAALDYTYVRDLLLQLLVLVINFLSPLCPLPFYPDLAY